MTQDKAGVPINFFPWTKDSEDESRQLILDISQAKFFLAGTDKNCKDDGVKLHCQAWAKNFKVPHHHHLTSPQEEGVKDKQVGGGRLMRLGLEVGGGEGRLQGGRLETCATTKK